MQQLMGLGLSVVLLVLIVAAGAMVTAEFQDQIEAGDNNTEAWEATQDGLDALSDLSGWIGLIVLVVIASVIIGYLIASFSFGGRRAAI